MGTSQFLSVPYALMARNVENDQVNDADADPTNELQDLTLNGTSLEISDGTSADLNSLQDGTGTDDQNLSGATLTGTSLEISIENGSSATVDSSSLRDGTGTDDQTLTEVLTQSNDGGASQIKNIADPVNAQDAATKAYVDRLNKILLSSGNAVKDIDDNIYPIVTIGTQVWMAEDLKVTHYPNGDPIPHITDNTAWANLVDNNTEDAYCFYNNDNTTDYGALYTYAAAIGDNWTRDNAVHQGVCPNGWHMPTYEEWHTLVIYLGGDIAGGKLKEIGTAHWNSPNTGATNESGFFALPSGCRGRYGNGVFHSQGESGYWWSSTERTTTTAYAHYLSYNGNTAPSNDDRESSGFSVRCVKD